MDNQNNNNQGPAGLPPSPPSQPKPPPPPPPEITIRTMKSDLDALKETGGTPPTPKPYTPPELQRETPRPPTPPPPPSKIAPAEFETPNEEPGAETPSPAIEEEPTAKFNMRKILLWGGATVIIVGIGLLGYFVVFPWLFPPETPTPPPPVVTPPTETPELPEIPGPEETLPEIPSAETPLIHQSLLLSPDGTSAIQLTAVNRQSISSALQAESQKTNPDGSLIEIVVNDIDGQASAQELLAALLPETSSEIAGLFEEDFTLALYYDSNGVWPVYILKLSLEASIVEAQAATAGLEQSLNLSNFFISSPGSQSGAFRDGQANGRATRYTTFSQPGAALNLAWADDKFIISTSYNGLREALTNLR